MTPCRAACQPVLAHSRQEKGKQNEGRRHAHIEVLILRQYGRVVTAQFEQLGQDAATGMASTWRPSAHDSTRHDRMGPDLAGRTYHIALLFFGTEKGGADGTGSGPARD